MCLCTFPSTVLTTTEVLSYKEVNKTPQDISSECCHTSICDSKRGSGGSASEEKVISVLKLLGPNLPVHSHKFHKKNIQGVEHKPLESFLWPAKS